MKKSVFGILVIIILAPSLFSGEKDWKKFHIELYGGYSWVNPADLNLRAAADERQEKYYNEDYYGSRSLLNSRFTYTKLVSSSFPLIKNAFPLGVRVKYYVNKHLGFSVGFKYLSRTQTKDVINRYSFPYAYGEMQYQSFYSPYTLFIRGYTPFIGANLRASINDLISAEGFLEVGRMVARCAYTFHKTEEWLSAEGNVLDRSSAWFINEKGEGSGYSLETGLRISIHMGRLSPFLEGGYAWQQIKNLSGPGTELTGSLIEETWEGDWGIKQVELRDEGRTLIYQYPSNYWEGSTPKHRDFTLDFSGFQLRLGISFGF